MLILITAGANSLLWQQVASVEDADIAVTAQMVENFRYSRVLPDSSQQKLRNLWLLSWDL